MKTLKTLFLSLILLVSFNSLLATNHNLDLTPSGVYDSDNGGYIGTTTSTYSVNIGDSLTLTQSYGTTKAFKVGTTNILSFTSVSTRYYVVTSLDFPSFNISRYLNANGTGSLTLLGTVHVNSGTATGVSEINKIQFNSFPNPVVDELTINGTSKLGQVSVFDITGRELFSELVSESTTKLDFTTFVSGTYIVIVGNTTRKIIKQ